MHIGFRSRGTEGMPTFLYIKPGMRGGILWMLGMP
jgi:hypothetical protein